MRIRLSGLEFELAVVWKGRLDATELDELDGSRPLPVDCRGHRLCLDEFRDPADLVRREGGLQPVRRVAGYGSIRLDDHIRGQERAGFARERRPYLLDDAA